MALVLYSLRTGATNSRSLSVRHQPDNSSFRQTPPVGRMLWKQDRRTAVAALLPLSDAFFRPARLRIPRHVGRLCASGTRSIDPSPDSPIVRTTRKRYRRRRRRPVFVYTESHTATEKIRKRKRKRNASRFPAVRVVGVASFRAFRRASRSFVVRSSF